VATAQTMKHPAKSSRASTRKQAVKKTDCLTSLVR